MSFIRQDGEALHPLRAPQRRMAEPLPGCTPRPLAPKQTGGLSALTPMAGAQGEFLTRLDAKGFQKILDKLSALSPQPVVSGFSRTSDAPRPSARATPARHLGTPAAAVPAGGSAEDAVAPQGGRVRDATGATDAKGLRVEFSVAPSTSNSGLVSAGLLIVNPPWTLASELKAILPELEKPLGVGGAARFRVELTRT